MLPGGLLYGDVAGRAELRGNVNGSVVVDVHVPGAVGRPKDPKRTVDAGIFAVVTADRDVSARSELDGQVHHTIATAVDVPGARGGAENGKVGQAVRSVGPVRRPVIPRRRNVAVGPELGLDIHCAVQVRVHIPEAGGRPPDGNVCLEVPVIIRRHRDVAVGSELNRGR